MKSRVNINIDVTIDTTPATDRKPYDNRIVKPGEVLVPMMVDNDLINLYEMDKNNVRTWTKAGRKFMVAFYPVPTADEKIAMSQLNSQLNEFLGEKRDARCLIPQPDGTKKVCPKKNGDNRCKCVDCPYNGKYEREDESHVSLETLYEEYDMEVADNSDVEEIVILADSLASLLEQLEAKEPRYAKILTLVAAGYTSAEIIEKIELAKSRGYQEINNAMKLAKELYNKQ